MKNIKKRGRKSCRIAAMGCVLILAASAAVTAWAEAGNPNHITDLTSGEKTSSQTVVGRYTPGKNSGNGTVVAYDITWGDMKFNYEESGTGTWNAATHEYDYDFDIKGWSPAAAGSNWIKVDNRSNTDIKATVSFRPTQGHWYDTVKFTEADQKTEKPKEMRLESAEKTNQVVSGSWFLQIIDGVLTKDEKIGTVVITVGNAY